MDAIIGRLLQVEGNREEIETGYGGGGGLMNTQ